jgi:hypothetical protein
MKTADERIEALKGSLEELVDALLVFAGERKEDGNYIPSPVQNVGIDERVASRMQGLAAAISHLRGLVHQI